MTSKEAVRTSIVYGASFVAMLLGLFFMVTVPFVMHEMATVREWPFREGTITQSSVSSRPILDWDIFGRPFFQTHPVPEIRGAYQDIEEQFGVSRIKYGDVRFWDAQFQGASVSATEAAVAKYAPGTAVRVYFSPSDPNDTFLELFAPWDDVLVAVRAAVGVLLMILALALPRKLARSRGHRR